jgi:hypothetical protein
VVRTVSGWWVAAFVVQWILLVVLAVVVVAIARQVGTLHLRLGPLGALEIDDEGPALGELLQPDSMKGRDGTSMMIGGPAETGRLTMFVSPDCPACSQVLPGVPAAARAGRLVPQVVSDPEAERRLGVPGTPYVVVMDEFGIVQAKGTVNNLEQLEGLVDTARQRLSETPGNDGRVGSAHQEAM